MVGLSRGALVLAGLFLAWGCSSETSAGEDACPLGVEGCPCTQGGGCDPTLLCASGYCVRVGGSGGSGGGGGTGGTSSGGTSSGGTSSGGGAGLGGGSSCAAGAGTEVCSLETFAQTAIENSDTLGSSKDRFAVRFDAGQLVALDGQCCALAPAAPAPAGDWGSWPCTDAYDCAGCLVYVINPAPGSVGGGYWVLGAEAASNGATSGCPTYSGVYDVCVPDCTGKVCGSDGCMGSCGACTGDYYECNAAGTACQLNACDQCLGTCYDGCGSDPSCGCCTGTGCMCDGACP